MRLIKPHTRINFLGHRYIAFAISAILTVVSIGSLAIQGLNLDVDFTGGVIVQVDYPQAADLGDVRDALAGGGYPDATVQFFGSTTQVLIRLGPQATEDKAKVSDKIVGALQAQTPGVTLSRVEFVGSQVGDQLVDTAGLALLYTVIAILIYVVVRFHWKLAVGGIVALVHDVVITAGLFSLFQWNFDLTVFAALLAILGFSINDTVVIFDRQRENYRRMRNTDTLTVMNVSINETLARTIMTSFTVLLADASLLYFGGESVFWFALAMMIGTVFGVYSSVYIASALALHLNVTKEDVYPPKDGDTKHHANARH